MRDDDSGRGNKNPTTSVTIQFYKFKEIIIFIKILLIIQLQNSMAGIKRICN